MKWQSWDLNAGSGPWVKLKCHLLWEAFSTLHFACCVRCLPGFPQWPVYPLSPLGSEFLSLDARWRILTKHVEVKELGGGGASLPVPHGDSPNTKLSGRKIWPKGPERTESMVPGSRSTRTALGT